MTSEKKTTRKKKATAGDRLIVANCSGFFGDRFSAAREMIEGGPIDVLTGDYLAELTMAILFRQKMKDPKGGYAHTFLRQMEEIMGRCLDKGIRVVSNAGGLNPASLAAELETVAQKLGLHPVIATIEGDDLMPKLADLRAQGESLSHILKNVPLPETGISPITANAYFGGWGIATALENGADIVVGGRLADAALVSGPAAWHFGWRKDQWDHLAGAAVAGHILECSGQATGGNYAFVEEVPTYRNLGFPIAEINPDGSSIITKHPGTGGLVSVGTVTAQLVYEIRSPAYVTPDVTVCFDSIRLSQEGPDRVLVSGVKGLPAPEKLKVCLNHLTGYRNSMTLIVPGLDPEKKAAGFIEALEENLGGMEQFQEFEIRLTRSDKKDPPTNEEAFAYLRISALDPDPKKVNRLSSAAVELALASFPGFTGTAPPGKGIPAIQQWPALVSRSAAVETVRIGDSVQTVEPPPTAPLVGDFETNGGTVEVAATQGGERVRVPLGRLFGARSGDKGGDANLGVWAKDEASYAFLRQWLTTETLCRLLPELQQCPVERYDLPNLLALNFYVVGFLGEGALSSLKIDPQAKTLGEYLRAQTIEVPKELAPVGR